MRRGANDKKEQGRKSTADSARQKDRQYERDGQAMQDRRADDARQEDRHCNTVGHAMQHRRTDDARQECRQCNTEGQTT